MFFCVICGLKGSNHRHFIMTKNYLVAISIIEEQMHKNIQHGNYGRICRKKCQKMLTKLEQKSNELKIKNEEMIKSTMAIIEIIETTSKEHVKDFIWEGIRVVSFRKACKISCF